MSAAAAPATTAAEDLRPRNEAIYRDDGPLARAIGRALGPAVPVPGLALLLAGVLPLIAAMAIAGGDASPALAGAVIAWLVLTHGLAGARWPRESFTWAVPPLVRFGEYAGLLWIAAIDGDAHAGAFALLGALAFRHYDLVYGLRHRAELPPAWLNALAGGWDGRLAVAWVLLAVGALPAGFFVWAALIGAASVAASVMAWRRFERGRRPAEYDDAEDEGE
jgi:hypothetical protein